MTLQKQYVDQLNAMYKNGQKWLREHPDTEALISWNFPPQVMLVAPISHAVDLGMVRTNPAGLELLKALWPWVDETEPTVLMCRVVLELKHETERFTKGQSHVPGEQGGGSAVPGRITEPSPSDGSEPET